MIQHVPILTVTLTGVALWLSGNHRPGARLLGWSLALVTQALLVLFGLLTEYREFALHVVIVLVLARNIVHNAYRVRDRRPIER